jgi:hypothetical protein
VGGQRAQQTGCTKPRDCVYSSVDGVLFDKSQTVLLQYPGGKSRSYTIPNTVIDIGGGVFASNNRLTEVTIPNGVVSIRTRAFSGCTSLRSVTMPSSVAGFGDLVFASCTNLTGVYFQGNAPAFYNPRLASDLFLYAAPTIYPISAIRSGRIIPPASTASAHHEMRIQGCLDQRPTPNTALDPNLVGVAPLSRLPSRRAPHEHATTNRETCPLEPHPKASRSRGQDC